MSLRATMRVAAVLVALGVTATTHGQSNINATDKFSWAENAGWFNWRDANGTLDGVSVEATFLAGFVWGENIGWINLGDGTPGTGTSYANIDGSDFGVNRGGSGDLTGFGWGENIGWVNFDTSGLGANRARFDAAANRFRGYVWGENVGWINLDDGVAFVGVEPLGPPNNDCADAISLMPGVTEVFDTSLASNDGPTPVCGGMTAPNDIWFTYTADCSGIAMATTCGSSYDTRLGVYPVGVCPPTATSLLSCNDDLFACNTGSLAVWSVVVGQTYLIQVGGFQNGTGSGEITVTCGTPLLNDNCADATPIFEGITAFDTTLASTDGLGVDPATCSPWPAADPILQADLWYKYTAPSSGTLRVTTCESNEVTTRLAVWDGNVSCPPDPLLETPIACNDQVTMAAVNCFILASLVEFPVVAGQSYLIQIGGSAPRSRGPGEVEITLTTMDLEFRRGDCNADGTFNIADAIVNLSTLFPAPGAPPTTPVCADACDANDDGLLNIADAIATLSELFPGMSGPAPLPAPGSMNCGIDPSPDVLDCLGYQTCP